MKGGDIGRVSSVGVTESLGSSQAGFRARLRDSEEFKNLFAQLNQLKSEKPELKPSAENSIKLKFSNHAVERLVQRGLHLSPEHIAKLEQAWDKVNAKGAREALVLLDGLAAVINVKNQTVVTVMDPKQMKEQIFTNIDSAVIMG